MNRLPDRWLPYKPIGKLIEGTRFIAFKVPLNKRFFHAGRDIPTDDHFTPEILLNEVQDLGLIIDLTATTRYYNPSEFENNDVQYVKVFTQGKEVPSQDVISKFTKAVQVFLERNGHNDKKIGVHCTHGINRTGFLICHYMIRELKLDPKDAIERFNSCRGYPMERDNYIESLLQTSHLTVVNSSPTTNNWRVQDQNEEVKRSSNFHKSQNANGGREVACNSWRSQEQSLNNLSNRRSERSERSERFERPERVEHSSRSRTFEPRNNERHRNYDQNVQSHSRNRSSHFSTERAPRHYDSRNNYQRNSYVPYRNSHSIEDRYRNNDGNSRAIQSHNDRNSERQTMRHEHSGPSNFSRYRWTSISQNKPNTDSTPPLPPPSPPPKQCNHDDLLRKEEFYGNDGTVVHF